MAESKVVEFRLDDVVRLRKPHPCGGFDWTVVRLGADLGLRCQTCGHRIMLDRFVVMKRLKEFVERGPEVGPTWPPPEMGRPPSK